MTTAGRISDPGLSSMMEVGNMNDLANRVKMMQQSWAIEPRIDLKVATVVASMTIYSYLYQRIRAVTLSPETGVN